MEFIARGGEGLLRRYHRAWIDSPDSLALVAVDGDDRILGALLGSLRPETHYRNMARRHGAGLTGSLLVAAVSHPRFGRELVVTRTRRYLGGLWRMRRRSRRSPDVHPSPPSPADSGQGATKSEEITGNAADGGGLAGEVVHVMVRPDAQGSGVGRALMEAARRGARDAGLEELVLVTPPGLPATAFYERLGWQRTGKLTSRSGEPFVHYRLSLR